MQGTIGAVGAKLWGCALAVGATPTSASDDDITVTGSGCTTTVSTTTTRSVEISEGDLAVGVINTIHGDFHCHYPPSPHPLREGGGRGGWLGFVSIVSTVPYRMSCGERGRGERGDEISVM